MAIAGDIVEEPIVDEGQPKATNPITDPPVEEPKEPEVKPDPETDPEEPKEPPIPKGVQKRIDRAVRHQREAENKVRALEERLAAMEQRVTTPPKESDLKEPTLDQFETFDQYVAAKAEFVAAKKIKEALSEREERERSEYEAQSRAKAQEAWSKRVAAATAEMPDFEEVLGESTVPMTRVMQDAIMDSDIGPKLAYFLATNPDTAEDIASMSPIGAIRALGRIEERLAQPTAKKTTNAPEPIKPVGTKASVKKDPGQMSDEEYAKWRKSAKG